jgi:hypothetical protein
MIWKAATTRSDRDFRSAVEGSKHDHATNRQLPMRRTRGDMPRRAGARFHLSLPCVQATHGQRFFVELDVAGNRCGSARRASNCERVWEDARTASQDFCLVCGSTLVYALEARPGMLSIPAGAFADPDFPAPTVEVYGERRSAWCDLSGADMQQESGSGIA